MTASSSSTSDLPVTVTTEPGTATGPTGLQRPPEPRVPTTGTASADVPESLRSVTNALPTAIAANWGRIAKAGLSPQMYAKIVHIATLPIGPQPGARALTAASLSDFLEFWMRVRNVAVEPEIALAPDGTLYAEWYKSQRQRLDVRFAVNKAIFGLFSNSNVLEGAESPETVASYLKNHAANPLQWAPQ